MKALAKIEAKLGLTLIDTPKPIPRPSEVLIRVHQTGICGTDIHIYNWDNWAANTIPYPLIIGHEFTGEIVGMGDNVQGFNLGDRISGEGHITCGLCHHCLSEQKHLCPNTQGIGVNHPGCFAEYIALPASNAFHLPNEINDDLGAIMDPLGNAVHTALSFKLAGEDVLITGAGPIGIMTACIAQHLGARHVVLTDVNPHRLSLASTLGVKITVNTKTTPLATLLSQRGLTDGFHIGMEMSGNAKALEELFKAMNHGGKVAILGIPAGNSSMDWSQVIFKSLIIKGIYGRKHFETWFKMTAMLQSGLNIAPIITHRFKPEDYVSAFEIMRNGQSGKVLLDWR